MAFQQLHITCHLLACRPYRIICLVIVVTGAVVLAFITAWIRWHLLRISTWHAQFSILFLSSVQMFIHVHSMSNNHHEHLGEERDPSKCRWTGWQAYPGDPSNTYLTTVSFLGELEPAYWQMIRIRWFQPSEVQKLHDEILSQRPTATFKGSIPKELVSLRPLLPSLLSP